MVNRYGKNRSASLRSGSSGSQTYQLRVSSVYNIDCGYDGPKKNFAAGEAQIQSIGERRPSVSPRLEWRCKMEYTVFSYDTGLHLIKRI
jgi:hypothetical protein